MGKGPAFEAVWLFITMGVWAVVGALCDSNTIYLLIGVRSMLALAGYLVMQIGLWHAENKWDEEGSAAWLEVAGGDKGWTPEELEAKYGKAGGKDGAPPSDQCAGGPCAKKCFKCASKCEHADGHGHAGPCHCDFHSTDAAKAAQEAARAQEGHSDVEAVVVTESKEAIDADAVVIPEEKLKDAFPIPWGFLIGWWLWGASYIFPLDGSTDVSPTGFGIAACVTCFCVSFVASIPMSEAVMHRQDRQKKLLSLQFLVGWITLGVMSALDATHQLPNTDSLTQVLIWQFCLLGPITIIMSQKILFGSRKMGTLWEASGKPNFHPIVYNMGGPLFVWGWWLLWLGTSGYPAVTHASNVYPDLGKPYIPLFMNARTLISFVFGCAMVPVVRFLDYSHDEDGPWMGENDEGKVFGKWWLGTDGTYFGLFLESPWPFIMAWTFYGFSVFFTFDNGFAAGAREVILQVNCIAQGVDAGILIQSNLYAGNMKGKQMFSLPFVLLFVALAINIGSQWSWMALPLSLPGAVLIILGQKTVFGARKRGDYTMKNNGKANPYDQVNVYSWGEVWFMMGWILISWGQAMPQ